ncbi:hypothetical protein M8J76_006466 [Diaphorina citri]|nr:hypothetical protein M8J76_006466 [Diaphorina citri]
MSTYCSVHGCGNNSTVPGITFHKFPINEQRRADWIAALNQTYWTPKKHSRICSKHFKEEDIDRTSLCVVRIRQNAKPTLFPANPYYAPPAFRMAQMSGEPSRKRKGSPPSPPPEQPPQPSPEQPQQPSPEQPQQPSPEQPRQPSPEESQRAPSLVFLTPLAPPPPQFTEESPTFHLLTTISQPQQPSPEQPQQPSPEESQRAPCPVFLTPLAPPPPPPQFTEESPTFHLLTPRSAKKKGFITPTTGKKLKTKLFNRERALKKERQRTYRLRKKLVKMSSLVDDLRQKYNLTFENCSILEGISDTAQFLVKRQVNKAQGKKQTKKYEEQLRSFALSLHFISPRAYEYVRQEFDTCLPSTSTLSSWYKSVDAEPGFCSEALNAIRLYCAANDGCPVLTSLMVDSMSIKQFVKWDGQKHVGYVNFGVDLDNDCVAPAKEALVFLLNCVNGSWKYPVAYFFTSGVSGEQLAGLVSRCLTLLHETGVTVCSLTFDGAASNVSMATHLGCSLKPESLKTYFSHPETGEKVYVFLDACHMLKLVRNTFGERNLISNDGVVQWSFITELFSLQDAEGLRLANKLTRGHINWYDQKMKVRLAAQTLSESVATAIDHCRESNLPGFQNSEATSSFLRKFNDLFDYLNSRSPKSYGTKKALSEYNFEAVKSFFVEMLGYITGLKNMDGSHIVNSNRKTGFVGFMVCIQSTLGIYEDLIQKQKKLVYLPMYKFSQDHLELLFSKIRSKGGWTNNPTATQFVSALKKIIVATELRDVKSGNCIPREQISILHASSSTAPSKNPMMNINLTTDRLRSLDAECDSDPLFDHDYMSLPEDILLSEISLDVVEYIGGFVVRHLKKKILCEECLGSLEELNPSKKNLVQAKTKGGLIHPSKDVFQLCRLAEKHFRKHFVSKGSDGRLVSNGSIKQVDLLEGAREVIRSCIGTDIFDGLSRHGFDQEVGSNHMINLIRCIVVKYWDIRLHYSAKRTSDMFHHRKRRQTLTHLITFQGL